MDWSGLPYFLSVARGGSLRAAAETLGTSHATVDRNLRALETAYGVRLFDRTPGGLSLTEAGETLLPLAQTAEETVISARRRLQGLDREASGLIRLSLPPALAFDVIAPILGRFATKHPGIELETGLTNRFEDLNRAEADVSVRIAFNVDDDVVGRRVLQLNVATFATQDYLDRHFVSRGPQGEGLTWIGWPGMASDWAQGSPFPKADIRHRTNGAYMQVQLCRAGMGMTMMPVYNAAVFPDLVQVPGTEVTPNRSLWVLLHSDLRRTTRVRLLVDHLVAEFKAMHRVFTHLPDQADQNR